MRHSCDTFCIFKNLGMVNGTGIERYVTLKVISDSNGTDYLLEESPSVLERM